MELVEKNNDTSSFFEDNNNNDNSQTNHIMRLRIRTAFEKKIKQFQRTAFSRRLTNRSSILNSKNESNISSKQSYLSSLQLVSVLSSPQINQSIVNFPLSTMNEKDSTVSMDLQVSKSILDFPNEILYKIFKFLPFDIISKKRMVCRHFNMICSEILNGEFKRLRNIVQQRLQTLKSQMPRRESARRQHELAREYDIIETVNMRLSLMQTMFSKHIDRSHCAFFAGQVLDEVRRILVYLKTTPVLNFAYKVTDELFDLSTMAVEYFKERIEPNLPDISYIGGFNDFFLFESGSSSSGNSLDLSVNHKSFENIPEYCSSTSSSGSKSSDYLNRSLNNHESSFESSNNRSLSAALSRSATLRIKKLETRNKKTNSTIKTLRSDIRLCKRKLNQNQKQLRKYRSRFEDYDKKLESTCFKLSSVLEELSKCKTEIQYLRSSTSNSSSSSQFDGSSNPPLTDNVMDAFLTPPYSSSGETNSLNLSEVSSKDKSFKRKLQFCKDDVKSPLSICEEVKKQKTESELLPKNN